MNYFEDWYTQPIDNEEEDQEKRWASLLEAAADVPTGGRITDRRRTLALHPITLVSTRGLGTDLIQQILNRNVTDMNLGLGDAERCS